MIGTIDKFKFAGLVLAAAMTTAIPSAATAAPPHCPPGLAKKGACGVHTGPQRHHHPHYRRGDVIERYRVIEYERYKLHRPRRGQVYVEVGGEIYLIAEATQRVIEAINLVDAASR